MFLEQCCLHFLCCSFLYNSAPLSSLNCNLVLERWSVFFLDQQLSSLSVFFVSVKLSVTSKSGKVLMAHPTALESSQFFTTERIKERPTPLLYHLTNLATLENAK